MKILYVCHRLPFPPVRGGKIRPFHMIKHLSTKHEVVVASLAETKKERDEGADLRKYCSELIVEVLPPSTRWSQAARALLSRRPSSAAYFWSSKLHQRIMKSILSSNFDMIFVHCAFVAQYVPDDVHSWRILDFGDLDSAKWEAYARHRSWPLSTGYGLEARKLGAYETKMAASFHHCTVTTRGELEEFARIVPGRPCTVIPNGVDGQYFKKASDGKRKGTVIVFVGRMDYFPNVDAVVRFAREVFPLVRRQVPSAELRVIGSNPWLRVRRLARIPGISITGTVRDVRPHLEDAAVSVAPLRIARGTQNKILESMAFGIPVVCTGEAVKGIRAEPGKHLLVGENNEDFASQVIALLKNEGLRDELTRAGRELIETAHAWSGSMTMLDRVLDHVCSATDWQGRRAGVPFVS